jgi:uncharacterized membrane protein
MAGTYTIFDDPSATGTTVASSLNDLDKIVGSYLVGNASHGFLYFGGNFTTIDDPSATQGTSASGINNAGQIVGSFTDSHGSHGFLRDTNGIYSTLDDPTSGASNTTASGINRFGMIVGSYFQANGSPGTHGFLFNPNGNSYSTLDDPNGNQTIATGINDGKIVGYYLDPLHELPHGFVYDISSNTYTTFNDTGGNPLGSTQLWGINDAGQIVGTSTAHGVFVYSFGVFTTIDPPALVAAGSTLHQQQWPSNRNRERQQR